ncbi:Protein CBG15415 [Caenorhabditis briggsae]|uniref:Protein CBG15415 n=1 Tax=Caenorhabditis briggsae TaxID=6238 RepID=A8XMB7_CAEBR|nr:Protein CBG15415 [Caenorhabditis briggsae]CAP33792.1 Protein CBG15415 [Caenorhabditis briggsae]
MALQLLKRPRPLPAFKDEEKGIYAQWKIKGFYYRKAGFPKMSVKGVARIRYAKLEVEGKLPHFTVSKQLVNIGYVENVNDDILDIRGCDFRLLIFGVQHVEIIRDWLRFLVIRQRIPHSLMGLPFDWQVKPIRDDQELQLSRISPFHCFKIW